ncbi:hypothetical protein ACQP1P_38795 [Dactylosporangium sp. CA-052675]|uniref:hypothetical protein n=1 Tax=Dactylosporangium sp. CA-052675 TaxID=3239927 RepID=UPI003D8E2F72
MSAPSFIAEAPLRQARRYVDRDLAERAAPAELRWLYDHPVLWLRALIQVELDVNSHIEKSKSNLVDLKPDPGVAPSREYLDAKAELDRRNANRAHFKRLVEKRKAEVVTIIGTDRPIIAGDFVYLLVRLAELIADDEVTNARDFALYWADRLARESPP